MEPIGVVFQKVVSFCLIQVADEAMELRVDSRLTQ